MENYEVRGFHYTEKNSRNYTLFVALPDLGNTGPNIKIFKVFPIHKNGIFILVAILRHGDISNNRRYSGTINKKIESKKGKIPSNFPVIPNDKKIGIVTIHEENIPLHSIKNQKIFEKAIINGFINDPNVIRPGGFYNPAYLKTFIKNNASSNYNKKNLRYAIEPLETGGGGTVDPIP